MIANKPCFAELTAASFKIGCLGFGGPAGQIALMHRIFVEEKKWIDEDRYLHALSYCMLLPGPEAQQLATYVGWLLHGVRGGIVAGALFVAPGAVVVLALSWLYAMHAQTPLAAAMLLGVKAAVLAFIVEALLRIGRRALKRIEHLAIAVLAFVALAFLGAPFPIVILAAGVLGLLWGRAPAAAAPAEQVAQPPARNALAAALVWGVVWMAPLAAALAVLGPNHVLTQVGLLFSQLAVVTFGGAYAVLAYLQQQAVEVHAWLTPAQMIDGLGLAETTPGPLILVNQFVGFLAGWQTQGGNAALALTAAAMAIWCTFAPSYLWIFAGAPYAERLRQNNAAASALAAITAAVLGVIANLALWFSVHVLFARVGSVATPWGRSIDAPELASLDIFALGLAAACAVALMRFKVNAALVVAGAAGAGLAWAWMRGAI